MTHVPSTLSACLCPDLRGCNWQVSVSENWWRPGVSNPSRQDACKATPQPSAAPILFGIDPRTRTLTDSFGDCSAAITLGGCIILVEQRGFEPLQNLLTSGLQPGALPLRRLLHINLVAMDNFEMSTYPLSRDYSASELHGQITTLRILLLYESYYLFFL